MATYSLQAALGTSRVVDKENLATTKLQGASEFGLHSAACRCQQHHVETGFIEENRAIVGALAAKKEAWLDRG